jgi:hypothetical protein
MQIAPDLTGCCASPSPIQTWPIYSHFPPSWLHFEAKLPGYSDAKKLQPEPLSPVLCLPNAIALFRPCNRLPFDCCATNP